MTKKMRVNYNIIYFFRSLTTCKISSGKKLIYFLCGHEYVIEYNSSSFNNDGFDGFLTKHNFSRKFYLYATPQTKYNEMLFFDYTFIPIYYLYHTIHTRFYWFVRNPNIINNKI